MNENMGNRKKEHVEDINNLALDLISDVTAVLMYFLQDLRQPAQNATLLYVEVTFAYNSLKILLWKKKLISAKELFECMSMI